MRTQTAAQIGVLNAGVQSDFIRVSIKDAGGVYRDISTYPAYNAVHEVIWRGTVDEPHVSGTLVLKREFYNLSIAPLMATSPVNTGFVPGGAYAPLIADNRAIKIEVAIVAQGTKPTSSDWMVVFRGLTDKHDAGGGLYLTIDFLGAFSRMAKQFIDVEYVYSFAAVAGTACRLRVWEPNLIVVLDEHILPATRGDQDPGLNRFYKVSQAGTTGLTEPLWNTGTGIVDGTAKHDYVGATTTGGNPVEQIMQNLMDDNLGTGDVATTLLVPASPGWAIRQFQQDRTYLFPALLKLSGQIGWDLREVWNAADNDFRLKFSSPTRTSPGVNYTFQKRDYGELKELSVDPSNIRNRWRGYYSDRADLWPDGTPKRKRIEVSDATSITNHGEIIAEIHEDSDSDIDASAEMTALLNAALSDCAEPTAQVAVELTRAFPWVELNDFYTFKADNVHFSADQSFAVVMFEHRYTAGSRLKTALTLRGKPTIGTGVWIARSVHPSHKQPRGAPKEKHFQGDRTAGPAPTTPYRQKPGGAFISLSLGLDKNAFIEEYEHHLYSTPGTTLDSSTLVTVSKDRNIDFGHLKPGDLTYHRVVPRTRDGRNKLVRGQPSAEQSFIAGWVEPRYLNPQTVMQPMPPNGSFEGQKDTSTVPDLWNMVTGTFGPGGDAGNASADSYDGSIAIELRNTTVASKIRSSFFPVTALRRYMLEAFIKKVGTPTATADLAVEWYDRSQTIIGAADVLGTVLSGIGTGWTRVVLFKQAPATAAYAKVYVAKHDNTAFAFYVDAVKLESQDRVLVRYKTAAGQAFVSNTMTIVNFDTVDYDTHSAVATGASWAFTVPTGKAGKYSITAAVLFNMNTDNAAIVFEFQLFKNGALATELGRSKTNPNLDFIWLHATSVLDLAVGDTIDVRAMQVAGANRSLQADARHNWIAISRVDPT